ncbi:hypothetical protein BX600DRAFT_507066 [Xylariales sp. PMI_506]|nr:hypothetical protein BX600DRAFT_507066 [Xylariales sp. PMI_506]
MARVAQASATSFGIFNDSSFSNGASETEHSSLDIDNHKFAPLRSLSVSDAQNQQSRKKTVDALAAELKKLHIGEPHKIAQYKGKPIKSKAKLGSRVRRPLITTSTILEVLETVPEDENPRPLKPAAVSVSGGYQHYIEVQANKYAQHPLAIAARNPPSVEEQIAKHRNREFEWVLTVKPPTNAETPASDALGSGQTEKLYFGCNLLPLGKVQSDNYMLLVTPLEANPELVAAAEELDNDQRMAMAEAAINPTTPSKPQNFHPEVRVEDVPPAYVEVANGDTNLVENTPSKSPGRPVSRIEDSVAALDELEEQLEAFHVAADVSPAREAAAKPPAQPIPADTTQSPRNLAQPPRSSPRPGSSMLKVKPMPSRSSPSARRSVSMIFLDSPKLKEEDKALLQAPPKKAAPKPLSSLLPPKQVAKSARAPTIPSFELPGEAVARRLKEQKEARRSMGATVGSASPNLRRIKSVKPPTRSTFELPGEAISRRKREAHEAQLKAQEEEERKRREFKARPIGYGATPSSLPRETATSRARQTKGAPLENHQKASSLQKRTSSSLSREPLASAGNQSLPRGRNLTTESSMVSHESRGTSNSTTGKRSSVSFEDMEHQRRRGREVVKRDSMLSRDREREKHEREAMARLAREQAAERSRMLSREWAEKQKRKRTTIGSMMDVVASSS